MNSFGVLFFMLLSVISTGFGLSQLQKPDSQDDAYWNDVIGTLLQDVAADLLEKKGNFREIDEINDTFGGIILNGKLKTSGGSIGDFSTLRFVNLSVSTTAKSLTVFLQVKLDDLKVFFDKFEANVRILSVDGSVKASVGKNLLTAQVTLKLEDDDCEASLDLLGLTEFAEIELAITGIELINSNFINKMANMVVNEFTPELKPIAEEKMKAIVQPYVALACEYLS